MFTNCLLEILLFFFGNLCQPKCSRTAMISQTKYFVDVHESWPGPFSNFWNSRQRINHLNSDLLNLNIPRPWASSPEPFCQNYTVLPYSKFTKQSNSILSGRRRHSIQESLFWNAGGKKFHWVTKITKDSTITCDTSLIDISVLWYILCKAETGMWRKLEILNVSFNILLLPIQYNMYTDSISQQLLCRRTTC